MAWLKEGSRLQYDSEFLRLRSLNWCVVFATQVIALSRALSHLILATPPGTLVSLETLFREKQPNEGIQES